MIHNKRLPTDCLAHLIVVSGSAVQAADSNAAVGFLRCVADKCNFIRGIFLIQIRVVLLDRKSVV